MLAFRALGTQTRIRLRLSNPAAHKAVYALLDKFKNHPKGWFSNLPSTGIEPVTFPMSRERATAAPTGLKTLQTTSILKLQFTAFSIGAFPKAGTNFVLQALRQLGLNSLKFC